MTTTNNLGAFIETFFDEGVKRFGSVEAFQVALEAYNADRARKAGIATAAMEVAVTRDLKAAAWSALETAREASSPRRRSSAYMNSIAAFDEAEWAHEQAQRNLEHAARLAYPTAHFSEIRKIVTAA